ncbi:transcriptional regulator, HxlR family [Chitinophaga costaii]|uniref:Transcriptional regulator, HxlR family n=1 Tax=Chitinophaga costaii TaxID=1335309 RepID=A0A1C4FXJ4_9BACT|nr:helix-turn-helix domain-containing protein [Chitinophaga costaii]PUZ20901.1 transcriptional regulator [Chitinophaga costaii]SCC60729.1 transcriptional regulator, HxlR family [Chitinophaga costaii]
MGDLLSKKVAFSASQCSKNLAATEDALYVVGGKWTLRVMIALLSGHTHFNDLQRTVVGISARALSGELKDLELNGLVERVVDPQQKPVTVSYLPTEYSRSLREIITALSEWGAKHKKRITRRM